MFSIGWQVIFDLIQDTFKASFWWASFQFGILIVSAQDDNVCCWWNISYKIYSVRVVVARQVEEPNVGLGSDRDNPLRLIPSVIIWLNFTHAHLYAGQG